MEIETVLHGVTKVVKNESEEIARDKTIKTTREKERIIMKCIKDYQPIQMKRTTLKRWIKDGLKSVSNNSVCKIFETYYEAENYVYEQSEKHPNTVYTLYDELSARFIGAFNDGIQIK